jgi:hypothetical protein
MLMALVEVFEYLRTHTYSESGIRRRGERMALA